MGSAAPDSLQRGADQDRESVLEEAPHEDEQVPKARRNLDDAGLFFNRELSWLKFNERVLDEALDQENPLLERLNFLAIFNANLDEFFMIRVSGLRRQLTGGVIEAPPDGMTPSDQLAAMREILTPDLKRSQDCWHEQLRPQLRQAGIRVLDYRELKPRQRKTLRELFKDQIFPVLTPLAFDPGHPFPHISNLSMNLAVVLREPGVGERFARLKIPQTMPRLLRIPEDEARGVRYERLGLTNVVSADYVWLEEAVTANLDLLFPDVKVVASYPFRLTRDADFEIEDDEAADLLSTMAEVVGQRHFGSAVRLEVDSDMPKAIQEILIQNVGVAPYQVYRMRSPIGMAQLSELTKVDRPDLKYPPYLPVVPAVLGGEEGIFSVLRRKRNLLLHHPYDSFAPVVNFLRQAAKDSKVLAIKQTLYRVGTNSPIVEALMEARDNGKQVAALVELKARFDEENNIGWARALEHAGVHVVYGVLGLKTHAKMSLVVRREGERLQRYVHLATGNYNPITARIYSDIGLFTCEDDIADDVSDLFNGLTGYSRKNEYRKLLVAPGLMRKQLIDRIHREIKRHRRHGDGFIAFKMNSLVDKRCIQALYRASQAGVRIDLNIRGICCLRPGLPGVSDNIRVFDIVGRFLEHSRIFYFRNGGDDEILLGSADLMPRNLDHRVEVLFPIEDPQLKKAIRDDILFLCLKDNAKARQLLHDGKHARLFPAKGEECIDSQALLLENGGGWRNWD